jgi:CDP-glucose 4,6-dehydratase
MTTKNYPNLQIFKNSNVVITGHTGFKGSWLAAWLNKLGANVTGIALDPPSNPSHFDSINLSGMMNDIRVDIRNQAELEKTIINAKPDFVFHLAAQSLVRKSYDNPIETWQTNILGTLNLLETLRKMKHLVTAVIITSDKCYENLEWVWGYKETDALGGLDPYSASKGAAELAIRSHVKSFFDSQNSNVRIASARAGNVIGGGDWAVDRIIPDCARAWSLNQEAQIRNPESTRPWQHVLEPLSGYLNLAASLHSNNHLHGEAFNFGPISQQNHSVKELVQEMSKSWENVKWRDVSQLSSGPHESNLLKLNCDKALHYLAWHAVMEFSDTVRMTAQWYRDYYHNSSSPIDITNSQIKEYTSIAKSKGLSWAQ